MSYLLPKSEHVSEEDMLYRLKNAKADFENAKKDLEMQLAYPKPGEYDSSPEHGTLQAFYTLAHARKDYIEVLEELENEFEYM